jgi:hypothetical protein
MLAPLFIESHAFLIQQERLHAAKRRRRRRDPAPDRPARAWLALPLRALATCVNAAVALAHTGTGGQL